MNQNKFPIGCEEYEKEIDRLTIQKDYDGLLVYLKKVEAFSESHSTPEYVSILIVSERLLAHWQVTLRPKEQAKTPISNESNLYITSEKPCLC